MTAQRACLDLAAEHVRGRNGPIFELGLGNGRTYDHLRERLPGREIYVFERQVAAHPDSTPPAAQLFLGDIDQTLPPAVRRFAGQVVLVHSDIGSGDETMNARIAAYLSATLPAALAPGALVLSDQKLALPDARALPLPEGVPPGRYYLLEVGGG